MGWVTEPCCKDQQSTQSGTGLGPGLLWSFVDISECDRGMEPLPFAEIRFARSENGLLL